MPRPRKLELNELKAGMQVFLTFPQVETEIRNEKNRRVRQQTRAVELLDDGHLGTATDIIRFLTTTSTKEFKECLSQLLSLTPNGSGEHLDRVCMVICPDQASWSKRRSSEEAMAAIAGFLIEPDDTPEVPWFIRGKFRLPEDFLTRLSVNIANRVHKDLQSQYNTSSGFAVESEIGRVVRATGYEFKKGQVHVVDDKEVDISVPNLLLPRVLIMASYNLTTASSQSQRAREQQTMYEHVEAYNNLRGNRNSPNVQLINVIDGGGWLARKNDLSEMRRYSHYSLSVGQLPDHLPPILRFHMK